MKSIYLNKYFKYLVIACVAFLTACSSTKHIPEDKYLLNKVVVKNKARDISKERFKPYIKQNANVQIIGLFKFHLWLYNLAGNDTTKGINKWLQRIGEEPVVYDEFLTEQTEGQLKTFMQNKGYFHAQVESDVQLKTKKKKAKLKYKIQPGEQFKLSGVYYKAEDPVVDSIIQENLSRSLLKKGKAFDVSVHDKERERITKLLRNNGYYAFSKEFIYYKVDTTGSQYEVLDSVIIKNARKEIARDKDTVFQHPVYKIKDVFYRMGFNTHRALNEKENYFAQFDTLEIDDNFFLYIDQVEVNPEVLMSSSLIKPGDLYRANKIDRTQALLSGLRLYRFVNIRFEELEEEDSKYKYLNCYIQLVPSKYQSYSIDIEGLNSSGNLGAGGNLEYQHKNLFKGAEEYKFGFGVSMQNQMNRQKEQFSTLEIGGETGITFPKFWMPIKIEKFRQRYVPKTSVSVAYNFQRRPDYTRTIANSEVSYLWNSGKYFSHVLTPLGVNYVGIPTVDSDFWGQIEDTYLRYSYEDHLVTRTSYSIVYNEQEVNRRKNFWYIHMNVEEAGNILNLLSQTSAEKKEDSYYEVLGIRYAQYVQGDIDIRYHHYLNKINSFAYRLYLGVGYPYGNLDVLPFEKRYFSGGANSIRAWPVRGLGPGSYNDPEADYYNQTGDIKLEANAEYRFKLFWMLEGALFLDAGNIFTIRKDISPEGGLFSFKDFTEKIAVGTGLGLRFDLKYFMFRIDTGLKLRDPVQDTGKRWIPGSRPFTWSDTAFNFAIGYPF